VSAITRGYKWSPGILPDASSTHGTGSGWSAPTKGDGLPDTRQVTEACVDMVRVSAKGPRLDTAVARPQQVGRGAASYRHMDRLRRPPTVLMSRTRRVSGSLATSVVTVWARVCHLRHAGQYLQQGNDVVSARGRAGVHADVIVMPSNSRKDSCQEGRAVGVSRGITSMTIIRYYPAVPRVRP
jgi:hypothetical protein